MECDVSLEIEQQLINFVQACSALETPIDAETDLLTTNVLDSLLLMELVLVIETDWGVKLQGNDIAPGNFRCLRNLAMLVQARRSTKPGVERASA
jgi:acyl carrier protein